MTEELKKSTAFTCPECCQPECAPGCAGLAIKDSVLPVRDAGNLRAALIKLRELHISTLTTPIHFNAYLEIIDAVLAQAAPASPALPDNLALSDNPLPANLAPASPPAAASAGDLSYEDAFNAAWAETSKLNRISPGAPPSPKFIEWFRAGWDARPTASGAARLDAPASPASAPVAPPVTPKHIEEIKDLLLWPVTEDDARAARDMLQSLHFDLSMSQDAAPLPPVVARKVLDAATIHETCREVLTKHAQVDGFPFVTFAREIERKVLARLPGTNGSGVGDADQA